MNNIINSLALFFVFIIVGCSSTETIKNETNRFGLTQEQYDYVKSETVPNGKLDFENQFQSNQLILIDGVAYNKRDAALYTWSSAMKKLGIKNAEDAISLYEEFRSVKLRDTQKKAMQNGFNK